MYATHDLKEVSLATLCAGNLSVPSCGRKQDTQSDFNKAAI
jgi:hypothetical protein